MRGLAGSGDAKVMPKIGSCKIISNYLSSIAQVSGNSNRLRYSRLPRIPDRADVRARGRPPQRLPARQLLGCALITQSDAKGSFPNASLCDYVFVSWQPVKFVRNLPLANLTLSKSCKPLPRYPQKHPFPNPEQKQKRQEPT